MTNATQLSSNWAGVTEMEKLRAYSRHERQLHSLIQDVARREIIFLGDGAASAILTRLRSAASDPAYTDVIPVDRLDDFIERVFRGHLEVRECHHTFIARLQAEWSTLPNGVAMARLFEEHAARLKKVYEDYGEALWQAQRLIIEESETNQLFRHFLQVSLLSRAVKDAPEFSVGTCTVWKFHFPR